MKKILLSKILLSKILLSKILLSLPTAFSSAANANTYDPATNQLIIPSITVDGTTYTDVVVTVGKILSIGGSSHQDQPKNERTCSWSVDSNNKYNNTKYELSVLPESAAIRVALTGLTNFSTFFTSDVSLGQGSNSTALSLNANYPGALWQGDYGFDGGAIPTGVIKGGVISRLPA